ncbi:hypothetical protein ANN_01388 [Periplaneta americana]|uniref:Transposable element Tc3 transposase n=1 Tax=Periplaneta americana TaxID=6978 RepID=A0ABQ8TTE3_PERAM|nr:hypothetical protein ANN_01388 [Periplaneta americana]
MSNERENETNSARKAENPHDNVVLRRVLDVKTAFSLINNFIFMQDGAPPHFSNHVRRYLNDTIPGRWIGRGGGEDQLHRRWPPKSPDLTP